MSFINNQNEEFFEKDDEKEEDKYESSISDYLSFHPQKTHPKENPEPKDSKKEDLEEELEKIEDSNLPGYVEYQVHDINLDDIDPVNDFEVSLTYEPQVPIKVPQNIPLTEPKRKKESIFMQFIDNPQSNMKKGKKGDKKKDREYPKKEYFRTKLLRSWKKSIRILSKNKDLEFNTELKSHFDSHSRQLSDIAQTENGPLTEAQKKRAPNKRTEKTFNNKFVARLFSIKVYFDSFKLFVISLFEGKSCTELCNKFNFTCCLNSEHTAICERKWEDLQHYSYTDLVQAKSNY